MKMLLLKQKLNIIFNKHIKLLYMRFCAFKNTLNIHSYSKVISVTGLNILFFSLFFYSLYITNSFLYNFVFSFNQFKTVNTKFDFTTQELFKSSYLNYSVAENKLNNVQNESENNNVFASDSYIKQPKDFVADSSVAVIKKDNTYLQRLLYFTKKNYHVFTLINQNSYCNDNYKCLVNKYFFIFPFIFVVLLFLGANVFSFIKNKKFNLKYFLISLLAAVLFCILNVLGHLAVFVRFSYSIQAYSKSKVTYFTEVLKDSTKAKENNIYVDSSSIKDVLKNSKKVPLIYEVDSSQDILKLYLQNNPDNQTIFEYVLYEYALNENPSLIENLNLSQVFVVNSNKLFVYKFTLEDLSNLLPILSKNIVLFYFEKYDLNFNDKLAFDVLNQLDYQKFQEKKEDEYKNSIKGFIAGINRQISQINNAINHNKNVIKNIDNYLDDVDDDYGDYVKEPQREYDKYCKGDFKNYPECKRLKTLIENNKRIIRNNEKNLERQKQRALEANKQNDQAKKAAQVDLAELQSLLRLIEENPITTEYQYGVYFPLEKQIKIKYEDTSLNQQYEDLLNKKPRKAFTEKQKKFIEFLERENPVSLNFTHYLLTSVHENLHAVSDQQPKNAWPVFIEESMTEYLSNIISFDYFVVKSKLPRVAYSDGVKILEELLTKMEKEELIKLYLKDKSDKSLRDLYSKNIKNYSFNEFNTSTEALFYMGYDDLLAREKQINYIIEKINK